MDENKGETAENIDSVSMMDNASVFPRIPAVQGRFQLLTKRRNVWKIIMVAE